MRCTEQFLRFVTCTGCASRQLLIDEVHCDKVCQNGPATPLDTNEHTMTSSLRSKMFAKMLIRGESPQGFLLKSLKLLEEVISYQLRVAHALHPPQRTHNLSTHTSTNLECSSVATCVLSTCL